MDCTVPAGAAHVTHFNALAISPLGIPCAGEGEVGNGTPSVPLLKM